MEKIGRYTPERIARMRIRLLASWEYNALVYRRRGIVVIVQNRGGRVTVNGKVAGASVEEAARIIVNRYGWELGDWRLEAYYG
jgi:hypothetical protein